MHSLNPQQQQIADHKEGPLLVIAGAGTGKTNALVHRVANLVRSGVSPESIVLLTFTRRAAKEMLSRAGKISGSNCSSVSGGTFHSFCNTILHRYATVLGYSNQFNLLDEADVNDLFQLLRSRMNLQKQRTRFPGNETVHSIHSASINRNMEIQEILKTEYPQFLTQEANIRLLIKAYTVYKKEQNLMDYDDLLVLTRDLLRDHAEIRKKLSEKYQYVLVDEYQDTNRLQAQIACLLASEHGNIMVVGDDAQCIYTFRGSNPESIFDFPKIFPETRTVLLEENYRSTPSILNLANAILKNFKKKYEKNLFTKRPDRDKPALLQLEDSNAEAEEIADQILNLREEGESLNDMAVLFRAGWHSDALEIILNQRKIPFKKYGGRKFTETAHIKDVLAFLRVWQNARDEIAWTRLLLLLPKVGTAKAKRILQSILESDSPFETGLANTQDSALLKELSVLFSSWKSLDLQSILKNLIEFYKPLMEHKYDDFYKREYDLGSLHTISQRYNNLHSFLADMTLDSPNLSQTKLEEPDSEEEVLTLSTIHSAKGLEWKSLFLISLVDGNFPSLRSSDMEEERRLFYVGVTRAQNRLFLSVPRMGQGRDGSYYGKPSRFLAEIESLPLLTEIAGPSRPLLENSSQEEDSKSESTLQRISDFFD